MFTCSSSHGKMSLCLLLAISYYACVVIVKCESMTPKLLRKHRIPERGLVSLGFPYVLFRCTFNSSNVIVSWLKNGKQISYDKRVYTRTSTKDQTTMSLLTIRSLKTTDNGRYSCTGSNIHGQGESGIFNLNVIPFSKPIIRQNLPPAKVVLYKGQSITLDCVANGHPPSKYAWSKKSGFISHRVKVSKICIIHACIFYIKQVCRDAEALVGQGGEQESKGTCEPRKAEKWGAGVHPRVFGWCQSL